MLLNIEIKAPHSRDVLQRYDYDGMCAIVVEYIKKYEIQNRTIVSSFEPLVTKRINEMEPGSIKILQLLNYENTPEPDGYQVSHGFEGINVDLHWLEQNVIE